MSVRILLGLPIAIFLFSAYETYQAYKEEKEATGRHSARRKAVFGWVVGVLTLLSAQSTTGLLLPTLSITDDRTGVQIRDVQNADIEYWLSTDDSAESWRTYAGPITGITRDTTVTARARYGLLWSDIAELEVRVDDNTGLLYRSNEKPDPSIMNIYAVYVYRDPEGETAGNHYVGYHMTKSDFEVTAMDTAGQKHDLDPGDYSISVEELTAEGDNPVVVTYTDPYGVDRTRTAHVKANKPALLKIEPALLEDVKPLVGMSLSNDDFRVTATYEDGSARDLGAGEFTISPDVVVEGRNVITVNFAGKSKDITFEGATGSPQAAESERNDDMASADFIETGTEVSASIGSDDDVDWYQFVVGTKGGLDLRLSHDQADDYGYALSAEVYGDTEERLLYVESPWGEAETISDHIRVKPGRYYVRVSSYTSEATRYRLTVGFSEEGDGYETEPNDDYGDADDIDAGGSLTGNLGTSSDVDMYAVRVGEGGSLSLTLSYQKHNDSYGSWRIDVLDDNGERIEDAEGTTYHNADVRNASWQGMWGPLAAGTYYVRIEAFTFCNEDYVLSVG